MTGRTVVRIVVDTRPSLTTCIPSRRWTLAAPLLIQVELMSHIAPKKHNGKSFVTQKFLFHQIMHTKIRCKDLQRDKINTHHYEKLHQTNTQLAGKVCRSPEGSRAPKPNVLDLLQGDRMFSV